MYDALFLGHGNFGSVMMGIYTMGGRPVPVAVKTLKTEDIPNQQVSFSTNFFYVLLQF